MPNARVNDVYNVYWITYDMNQSERLTLWRKFINLKSFHCHQKCLFVYQLSEAPGTQLTWRGRRGRRPGVGGWVGGYDLPGRGILIQDIYMTKDQHKMRIFTSLTLWKFSFCSLSKLNFTKIELTNPSLILYNPILILFEFFKKRNELKTWKKNFKRVRHFCKLF